jgi:hypothetical protein
MTSPTQQKPKRFRSANWVIDEELCLVAVYQEYRKGPKELRRVMWDNMADQLAAKGHPSRRGASLEQKWANMTQASRPRPLHRRRTRRPPRPAAASATLPVVERARARPPRP